jgi:NTP pyrophosphatase (non-canonical NTP hydrolase)
MTVVEFQRRIDELYGAKDRGRGLEGTFMWFTEEVGELSRALRRGATGRALTDEFADVFAWLATLASIAGVDLEAAALAKYGAGCPRCHATPCRCAEPKRAE